MGNILKIIKEKNIEKKMQNIAATNNHISFFEMFLNYNFVSNNIENVVDDIFLKTKYYNKTKSDILKNDQNDFIQYMTELKDENEICTYKNEYDSFLKDVPKSYVNSFISATNKVAVIQNLFDIIYSQIKYIEEFEIISNRINYFFDTSQFFKNKGNLISVDSIKKADLLKQSNEFYNNEKIMLTLLNKESIKDLNDCRFIITEEVVEQIIDGRLQAFLKDEVEKLIIEKNKNFLEKEEIEKLLKNLVKNEVETSDEHK